MYKKGHYNKIQKQISNDLFDGITATEDGRVLQDEGDENE